MNMRISLGAVPCTLLMWLGACAGTSDSRDDPAASVGATDGDSRGDPTAGPTMNEGSAGEGSTGGEDPGEGSTGEGSTGGEDPGEGSTDEGGTSEGSTGEESTGVHALEDDGDSIVAPAVFAQFRSTSPGPVTIGEPLFNDEPIDTRGIQYVGAISAAADPSDHVRFSIVPGENDPYLRVTLACADPQVRVDITRADDVLDTVLCGDDQTNVLLDNADSLDVFDVTVYAIDPALPLTEYVLSLDAFCFGGCDYRPYAP